jgi:hypothetical protein
MTEHISPALAELITLINAATWHKQHCADPECGVALYHLGLTAKRLVLHCWMSERMRARRLIAATDWS